MQPRTGTGSESRKGQCGVGQLGTTAWWRRKSQARQRSRDVEWGRMWHRLLLVSAHGDLTSLAPHQRLPESLVVPREKTPTGAAARGNP